MKTKRSSKRLQAQKKAKSDKQPLFNYSYKKPGTIAGTVIAPEDAEPTEIILVNYDPTQTTWIENATLEECQNSLNDNSVTWIDVVGLGQEDTLQKLGEIVKIHPLTLEDIVRIPQRPKIEEYETYLFLITQMALLREEGRFWLEQVSLVIGKNYLIMVQEENKYDCLEPLRERIRHSKGIIRQQRSDYLAYAVIDAIIDGYFPVLESYGEKIEELENEILLKPNEKTLEKVYQVRQELLSLRRAIWPQRDMLNSLIRDEYPFISSNIKPYLRDCYDHTVQIIDVIENYREFANGLMEFYLSSVGNKMNEIMKTLTVISTIFIPLTFVAGIYGMNFNTEKSPFNMPELDWYWGYPLCLGLMLIIAVSLIYFFWRRGWFNSVSTFRRR